MLATAQSIPRKTEDHIPLCSKVKLSQANLPVTFPQRLHRVPLQSVVDQGGLHRKLSGRILAEDHLYTERLLETSSRSSSKGTKTVGLALPFHAKRFSYL